MKALDEELLYLASENTLVNLKADATELLKSYHETETIITNKSTSLLQVLFPVFVGIFGYILVEIQTKSNPKLFWFACIEEIVIFLSCYYLFESLYLKKIALSGVKPSNILHDDIIKTLIDSNCTDDTKKIHNVCKTVVYYGRLDCLKYAHENGCRYYKHHLLSITYPYKECQDSIRDYIKTFM
jgi:hypothetical protein